MKLNNGVVVDNYSKPYFIAEMNTSHFGNIDIAKQMIDAAKKAHCNCVKFQSWSAESLYSQTYYRKNPIAKRIVNKFSLSSDQLKILADYAHGVGIDFASTPYSREEVDFLVHQCGVPFIKVASMEINNYPYLDYIARTGSAIILSTGMADQAEITKAVQCIHDAGNYNLCVLHCVSIYPAEPSTIHLRNMPTMRGLYPNVTIGYSDHTLGVETPIAAVALGAAMIEKHFTLDASKIGMDNQMAMEPDAFAAMVQSCNVAWESLGLDERLVSDAELAQRSNMRRSIVSRKTILAGAHIVWDDIDFKRPGDGYSPSELESVLGKVAVVDIPSDEVIYPSMIEQ